MEITSFHYLIFVLVFLIVYQLTPEKLKNYWLFFMSSVFYGLYSPVLLLALLFSIGFNYYLSSSKLKYKTPIAVVVNLLLLSAFKFELNNYIVPIGISFFTFQALSFVISVKTEKVRFIHFANYMSFFPQLIAGPIESFENLGSQFKNLKSIQRDNILPALFLILKGLFLKLVIADRCGVIVDEFFSSITDFDGYFYLFANLLFTFQILFDFSAYCLIAKGVAHIIGVQLSLNFNQPYLATSLSDFWRRWHITLHIWLKQFIFYPIKKKTNWIIALGSTFNVSGLWHGYQLHFIFWGVVCFVFLLIDKYFIQKFLNSIFLKWAITFLLIFISWTFFRIQNLRDISELLSLSWSTQNSKILLMDLTANVHPENWHSTINYGLLNIPFSFLDFYILMASLLLYWASSRVNFLTTYFRVLLLFIGICLLGYEGSTPFIYLQF